MEIDPQIQMQLRIQELAKEIITKKQEYYRLLRQQPLREVKDYSFITRLGVNVKLSELFGDKDELILVHNMGKKCPYCTLWADGFNGLVQHLENRAAFVVSTPDPPKVMREFARSRHWSFNMVSTIHTDFKTDMGYQTSDGEYLPGVTTFYKDTQGMMFRVADSFFGTGDDFCSAWYFFDMLHNGDTLWEPKLMYNTQ